MIESLLMILVLAALIGVVALLIDRAQPKEGETDETLTNQELRETRDSWQPPPFSNVAGRNIAPAVGSELDELLPPEHLSDENNPSNLKRVFLCYLIWDRRVIGKPHPDQRLAHEYGFEWTAQNINNTAQRLTSFATNFSEESIRPLWGTRHHMFAQATQLLSFSIHDAPEQSIRALAWDILQAQWKLCELEVSCLNKDEWEQLFYGANSLSDLENRLKPVGSFGSICEIRDFIEAQPEGKFVTL